MKNIKLLLIPALTFIFIGCEKEIKVNQENYAPKTVLNCLLNPLSDTVRANLSESRDMLYDKNDFPPIKNATIVLYDNNVNVGTFTETSDGQYVLPYTVTAGHTYKITVTNTKFDDVFATTIVPNPAIINNFNVDLVLMPDNLRANININFKDSPNEDNFYGVAMERIDTNRLEAPPSYPGYEYHPPYANTYFCSSDLNIEFPNDELDGGACSDLVLFSDKGFNGQDYNFNCYSDYFIYLGGAEITDTTFYTKIKLFFKTYNSDYYKYVLSTKIAQWNYGNPFAEPVRIYNNIEGGFGIFGALNTAVDSVSFN